jgi:hypothetical protein
MTERIKELVTATDAWCDQNFPPDWTDRVDEFLPLWNEKFAELIIRECANICEDNAKTYKDSFKPAKAAVAESTSNHCAMLIKRTYGVE